MICETAVQVISGAIPCLLMNEVDALRLYEYIDLYASYMLCWEEVPRVKYDFGSTGVLHCNKGLHEVYACGCTQLQLR